MSTIRQKGPQGGGEEKRKKNPGVPVSDTKKKHRGSSFGA